MLLQDDAEEAESLFTRITRTAARQSVDFYK